MRGGKGRDEREREGMENIYLGAEIRSPSMLFCRAWEFELNLIWKVPTLDAPRLKQCAKSVSLD